MLAAKIFMKFLKLLQVLHMQIIYLFIFMAQIMSGWMVGLWCSNPTPSEKGLDPSGTTPGALADVWVEKLKMNEFLGDTFRFLSFRFDENNQT